MKTRISKLLPFLFLLVINGQVFPKTFLHEGDLPPAGKGSLEGRVLHKQTGEPVEYATVVLFSLPDTVMFNGTVSNPDGIFLIENLSVVLQVSWFKYTRRRYGEGRRIFLMSPIHHHYQKKGIPEAKIVTRFWIIGILLAVLTIVTLKVR